MILIASACALPQPSRSPSSVTSVPSAPVFPDPSPSSSRFEVRIRSPHDDAEAMLTLIDGTGFVSDVSSIRQVVVGHGSDSMRVANRDADTRVLLVRWGSLRCRDRPTLTLRPAPPSVFVLALDPGPPERPDCDAAGVDFAVQLTLTSDVPAQSVTAYDTVTDVPSWGLAAPGSDGTSEPVVIADVGSVLAHVVPSSVPATALAPGEATAQPGMIWANSVLLAWAADGCQDTTAVDLSPDATGSLGLTVTQTDVDGAPCTPRHAVHALELVFNEPIAPDTLRVRSVQQ